jgi:hypothetical protein
VQAGMGGLFRLGKIIVSTLVVMVIIADIRELTTVYTFHNISVLNLFCK